MNPAIHAAIIAATQQEAVKEKIEHKLREAGALGASSAILFDPADKTEQKLLEVAVAAGKVVRTADGRVYLNERAVADFQEGQGFMALLILLVVGSVITSVAVLLA